MGLTTPDRAVRPQIEATKDYLRTEGFSDVEDPPQVQSKAFERNLHTIMAWTETKRILRLSYTWLSERSPDAVREWLGEKDIAGRLRRGTELSILGDGTIEEPVT